MKKIQESNFWYRLLRPYVDFVFKNFYRKVYISGKENIPLEKPYILAPNHQNALMDALIVLGSDKNRIVFLARSDIFKQPTVAKVLRFLKIMPVYRIRDGRGELDKNTEIFEKSVSVLNDQVPLCLMPEGKQSFMRTLLPLVKGMFRIAFMAQEKMPDKEIMIVPVGIDYEDYVNPNKDIILQFGKPISVKEYSELYVEHSAKALNDLKDTVAEGISALIQNIRSEKYYNEFYELSLIASCPKVGLDKLKKRQEVTLFLDNQEQEAPAFIENICEKHAVYKKQLNDCNVNDKHISKAPCIIKTFFHFMGLFILFPLYFTSFVLNFIPFFATKSATKIAKQPSFKSSIHVVARMAIFLVYYLLLFVVLGFSCNWAYSFGLVLFAALSCKGVEYYQIWGKEIFQKVSFFIKRKRNKLQISNLQNLRNQIVSAISNE